MRNILTVVFGLLLVACSSVRVSYDYDKEVDFSGYTTYNYFPEMNSGLSQLDEKRLVRILDSTLQSRGYRLAEEPEIFVNILSSEFQTAPNSSVGVGIGGGGRNVGGGISVGLPLGNPSVQRNIQFDFVDAQRDALFWQATAESGYRENASPSERERRLEVLVKKVFSKFPPKS